MINQHSYSFMIYFVSILANVYPTADKIVDPYDSNDRSLMVTDGKLFWILLWLPSSKKSLLCLGSSENRFSDYNLRLDYFLRFLCQKEK